MLRFADDIGATEVGKGQPTRGGEFTGDGLDLHDQLWGERHGGGLGQAGDRDCRLRAGNLACHSGTELTAAHIYGYDGPCS